jgi:hypothetical protein
MQRDTRTIIVWPNATSDDIIADIQAAIHQALTESRRPVRFPILAEGITSLFGKSMAHTSARPRSAAHIPEVEPRDEL